jgi:nucleoside-diphosphate-sugar epimerase
VNKNIKIVITGGAGFLGRHVTKLLNDRGFFNIEIIDKSDLNILIFKNEFNQIPVTKSDLSIPGEWSLKFKHANLVITLHAQISGNNEENFIKNNITSMALVLAEIKKRKIKKIIHVSSSSVNSCVRDFYSETKSMQEMLVVNSGLDYIILRPTLMFGKNDIKHLGWIVKFMEKFVIFPVPGNGKFIRQPLYVDDFCGVILSCVMKRDFYGVYDITGMKKISYITIINDLKKIRNIKVLIFKIPIFIFKILLDLYSLFDKTPPFTSIQLKALMSNDDFKITNWPELFGVTPTKYHDAFKKTFTKEE